jgi:hypothetical protein
MQSGRLSIKKLKEPQESKQTMETNSGENRIVRLVRLTCLASAVLMAAWLLPPVVHTYRHLCPVKPDGVSEAGAVPSFARQTGMACTMCHTVFPQLTPYGRRFKLNGYTLARQPDITDAEITDSTATARRTLSLNSTINPLSAEIVADYGHVNRAIPSKTGQNGNQNDDLSVPSAVYLWAAGRVTDKIGAFLQLDYSKTAAITANGPAATPTAGGDNMSIGPSEIMRYADHTDDRKLVWGATATNGGAAKGDLWSSPVHGFSLLAFGNTGGVGAATKAPAVGGNGGSGLTQYAMYDDQFYASIAETHQDNATKTFATPGDATQVGWNPELRVAWEKNWDDNSLMLGGMVAHYNSTAGGAAEIVSGPNTWANSRTDMVADWQYQYITDRNLLSFSGAFTTERNSNNPNYVGAAAPTPTYSNDVDYLHQFQASTMYFYKRMYGGVVTYYDNDGTDDSTLYGGNGSPKNQYWAFSLDYLPWDNTRFFFQYNYYTVLANKTNSFYGTGTLVNKPSDANYWDIGVMYAF